MDARDTRSGHGDAAIGRRTAAAISIAFVVLISIPAAHQAVTELRQSGKWRFLNLFREVPTHESLKGFEEALAQDSELGRRARVAYQSALTGALGEGNEKILIGRDGFLFFRKEVDMIVGPGLLSRAKPKRRGAEEASNRKGGTDPVVAIVDTHRQLEARGVRLVFVPIPVKPFVYPENVWPGYPAGAGPAWNRDREEFKSRLAGSGVDVLDVTDDLWAAKARGEVFLKLDTHWTPFGLSVAADRIAAHLRPLVGPARTSFPSSRTRVTHDGDLLRMIEVLPGNRLFEPQTVETLQCAVRGDDSAPVLLLGDSFANIYSRKELEWGERAGLAEQLALRLGLPVQTLALNGGGATSVRELLARKPGALKAKLLVLWACSARDLWDETVAWERVPLPPDGP